jgi:hypothetical protein
MSSLYLIEIEGHVPEHWSAWLGDLHITYRDGNTIIEGYIRDQTALHGLLARIRDLGVPLIFLKRISKSGRQE